MKNLIKVVEGADNVLGFLGFENKEETIDNLNKNANILSEMIADAMLGKSDAGRTDILKKMLEILSNEEILLLAFNELEGKTEYRLKLMSMQESVKDIAEEAEEVVEVETTVEK